MQCKKCRPKILVFSYRKCKYNFGGICSTQKNAFFVGKTALIAMDSSMVQWKIPQFSTRALSPSNAWRWVLEKCRPSASERNCISFHPTSGAKWVTLTVGDSDDFFPKGRWQQQDDSGNYPWQDKVVREGAGQEMGRVNSGEDVLKMPLTIHIFSQNIGNQYSDISGGKSLWEK